MVLRETYRGMVIVIGQARREGKPITYCETRLGNGARFARFEGPLMEPAAALEIAKRKIEDGDLRTFLEEPTSGE